jgi:uncharacterized membrane protein
MNPEAPPIFHATLEPHRSLSPTGFVILMSVIAAVAFAAGLAFALLGAWPVFGFLGLDVLLIYLAFKANYRSGRMHETLLLTEETLTVERVGPGRRRQSWSFQPYWVRVEMDDPPEHRSQITLASHGRRLVIGAFLAPEERADFARALRDALDRLKHPPAAAGAQETGGPAV